MFLDTGALPTPGALAARKTDPVRLARALRTLAGALDAARPAINAAPAPWGWTAGIATSIVIGGLRAYAEELDPAGKPAGPHGWQYGVPDVSGPYVATQRIGELAQVMVAQWDPRASFAGWSVPGVTAWQEAPPPAGDHP